MKESKLVKQPTKVKSNMVLIVIIYLAGIFMGAIDTGIVTPARTIIQNNLGIDPKTGIWMITIYTLAYAASIPIMGKLADRFGRKYIYLASIFLFGFGSLLCGLSQSFASFPLLIAARAIQAIGGGGIMPVATAEFGTTFPKEKRGMALGLVGGVYGIANIFGASAGSAILDIFGKNNWQYIFFVNLPITVFILIAGLLFLPNTKAESVKKIDFAGITVLTAMVLSLLYGLRNIDFFAFTTTIGSTNVYPFLLAFLVLLPVFLLVEKKAQDPVINLSYFKNSRIVITLLLSFVTGIVMMGMIFVPQFSENALRIASGSGGYFVILLGLFAGVGAPISGKLIDKFGVKIVLAFGFIVTILASLFLIFVTINSPTLLTVSICLILMGLGMGFTMGTPLNYMMLENTDPKEANSALATLSLIRSIGTAIAPAIMIAFLAQAGMNVQTNVMQLLPKEVSVPPLKYSQEIMQQLDKMKQDPSMQAKLVGINFPDFSAAQVVKIDMNNTASSGALSADLLELMQSADVTNITERSKILATSMFTKMTPKLVTSIQGGVQKGIDAMASSSQEINKAISGIDQGLIQLEALAGQLALMPPQAFGQADITELLPAQVKAQIPQMVLGLLKGVKTPADLQVKISIFKQQKLGLEQAKISIEDTLTKMTALQADVPVSFEQAQKTYLAQIDAKKLLIEDTFQTTLDVGFKNVYSTTAIAATIALFLLMFYRKKEEREVG
ncbi:MAG: MFS transporter [Clostridia bacterium]